jgi:hypothetical protein
VLTEASPATERRRARPGSLERPVNGRLYRGAWLVVVLPLLLLAFSVARPAALAPPSLPPAFDPGTASSIASDLASRYPRRAPGTPGAAGATAWFRQQLEPYGFDVKSEPFTADVHGRRATLVNLVAEKPGRSPDAIVVMAHRDDTGAGSGLDDNASGTAAMIELARSYAPSTQAPQPALPYSLVFLSTEGAAQGALGAAHFAASPAVRGNVLAVINLDAVGGRGEPRLEFNGDTARSPAPGLLETLRASLVRETGRQPAHEGGLQQLIDLGFPFSAYEQAPFVSRGFPAVTITTAGARPPRSVRRPLDTKRLGQVGLAVQDTVDAMEQGVSLAHGPSSYVFLDSRVVRGWAIELVLAFMLLPFIAASVDLFARCRRRHIPVASALRSYRSRLGFWVWVGIVFLLFAAGGVWGSANGRPPSLEDVHWPVGGLIGLGLLGAIGWALTRDRLAPRRQISAEEQLAGHTAALLALSVVGLLLAATDPFALLFVLPSLHAWLWLPQVQSRGHGSRAAVLLLGLAGPALLVWSFAVRYGLGWDAPWYVVRLFAARYAPLPLLVIGLGWLAAAGQLAALAADRYAPYPQPGERPRRGPIRELLRTLHLAQRRRRAVAEAERVLQ